MSAVSIAEETMSEDITHIMETEIAEKIAAAEEIAIGGEIAIGEEIATVVGEATDTGLEMIIIVVDITSANRTAMITAIKTTISRTRSRFLQLLTSVKISVTAHPFVVCQMILSTSVTLSNLGVTARGEKIGVFNGWKWKTSTSGKLANTRRKSQNLNLKNGSSSKSVPNWKGP